MSERISEEDQGSRQLDILEALLLARAANTYRRNNQELPNDTTDNSSGNQGE